MDYKITLITPVYNAQKTLPRSFESVKAQTIGFENIEYILVDDVSTDGSDALIDSYAAQYPNVRALHMPRNSGTAGAPRNLGMDNASAPYLMFLDNDDCLFPNACEVLYTHAQQSGADIVGGDAAERAESGRTDIPESEQYLLKYKGKPEGVYDFRDFDTELSWVFCFNFWTKIFRREIVEKYKIRFSEGLLWEDLVFLYLYVSVCKNGEIVRADIIDYLVRESSLSHGHNMFFYTSIPKSIELAINKAREIGVETRFAGLMDMVQSVEYYVNCLINEKDFEQNQMCEILEAWKNIFTYAHERGFHLHTAYARIITRDSAKCSVERTYFDLLALREAYFQRKAERDGIFASRTWKIASAIQKLRGGKSEVQ